MRAEPPPPPPPPPPTLYECPPRKLCAIDWNFGRVYWQTALARPILADPLLRHSVCSLSSTAGAGFQSSQRQAQKLWAGLVNIIT